MNFQRLWENMKLGKESEQPVDDRVASVIRTGFGASESFWDDFVKVLNNSEGLAQLLDVSVEDIATWRNKVTDALDKVKAMDSTKEVGKNKKLVKTGLPDIGGEDEEL
jgi:hypothetical protein